MSILKGIKFKDDATVHQLDYESGIANKPTIVKSWNDLEDKPFHDDLDAREIIINQTELILEEDTSSSGIYQINYPGENPLGLRFNEGETLIYIWNGFEYECTTRIETDGEGVFVYKIGNEGLNNENAVDTGEPFFIAMLGTSETPIVQTQIVSNVSSATLEIQRAYKTIQQMDGKYVKDMYYESKETVEFIPSKEITFTVYVDDGTPSAWNESSLEWDTSKTVEIGKTYTVVWDGVKYESECYEMETLPCLGNQAMITGIDTGEPFFIAVDKDGLMGGGPMALVIKLEDLPSDATAETTITHTVSIYGDMVELKQIAPKYIKDMYYSEFGEIELLPIQMLTFTDGEYATTKTFTYEEGKTYKVEFDGTVYECVCQHFVEDGSELYFIGNIGLTGVGNDTGEPFISAINVGNDLFAMMTTDTTITTHTVRIYQDGEIVQQIPSKYINGYTKEEIDAMFGSLVNGDEVAY